MRSTRYQTVMQQAQFAVYRAIQDTVDDAIARIMRYDQCPLQAVHVDIDSNTDILVSGPVSRVYVYSTFDREKFEVKIHCVRC